MQKSEIISVSKLLDRNSRRTLTFALPSHHLGKGVNMNCISVIKPMKVKPQNETLCFIKSVKVRSGIPPPPPNTHTPTNTKKKEHLIAG